MIALGLGHRGGAGGVGVEEAVQGGEVGVECVQLGAVCGHGPGGKVDRPVEVERCGGERDEVRSQVGQGVGRHGRGALRVSAVVVLEGARGGPAGGRRW